MGCQEKAACYRQPALHMSGKDIRVSHEERESGSLPRPFFPSLSVKQLLTN